MENGHRIPLPCLAVKGASSEFTVNSWYETVSLRAARSNFRRNWPASGAFVVNPGGYGPGHCASAANQALSG